MSTDCGDETADVYESAIRRSRKDRFCDACNEPIRRGDLYHTTRVLFEGSWDWDYADRCARCEAMFRVLSPLMGDEQMCDWKLNCGHTWEDNFDDPPPVAIQALAFLTPAEAQILLERWPKSPPLAENDWRPFGPLEAPERTIARLLGWAA